MRILHVESGRRLYGGARQAGYLINGLADAGIENVLICEPQHPLTEKVGNATVVPFRSAGDLDLSYFFRLRRLIRAHSPDLVQVHSRRGADRYAGRAASGLSVPAVLTRRVQSREPAIHLRRMSRHYSAVVAISGAVAQQLSAAGVDPGLLRRIPSVVDSELFRPDPAARQRVRARFGLAEDVLVAGIASQLIRRKGIEELLSALPAIMDQHPRFRLLIFGQGCLRDRLKQQLGELHLDGRVQLCGFLPDWPAYLPGLDLLLHPARREGLGNAVIEAMAAAVPVVAQAAGGIVDVIDDGTDGWLVDQPTTQAWQQVLPGILADPGERERRALAARRKILSTYTIEAMTASYIRLYQEVLGHAG